MITYKLQSRDYGKKSWYTLLVRNDSYMTKAEIMTDIQHHMDYCQKLYPKDQFRITASERQELYRI